MKDRTYLGNKKNEIDIKGYETIIDYVMGVVGLDTIRYLRVYIIRRFYIILGHDFIILYKVKRVYDNLYDLI
jgi:hypothetical protein